jgi:peptide/nickel transport system ATP-binding protein
MTPAPLLEVSGLRTWIGSGERAARAVDGVDLSIARGETLCLLGESGCGKSMTALSIMRLLPEGAEIRSGEVRLEGEDLVALPEEAMRLVRGGRIGMIFQEPQSALNPVFTVGQQIGEVLAFHGADAARARVLALLDAVGIPDRERRLDEYPHQLSGGMKQRVMVAIAIAAGPGLLIADEPSTALDVTIQAQVLELLKSLQRERGMALLFITHDLGVVSEIADRVAVMYAGQIVESGARAAFFKNPAHPYSRKLFDAVPGTGKRGRALAVIPGTVPALWREFPGCRFEARCDRAFEICKTAAPELLPVASGQAARCHLHDPRFRDQAAPPPAGAVTEADGDRREVGGTLLEASDIRVHFPIRKGLWHGIVGHVRAVDGVSLTIPSGTTLALVGESGCGKTTMGKAILRLLPTTSGTVRFAGEDLTALRGEALRRRRAEIQVIFQDPYASMNPRMTVGAIIAEGMLAQGIGRATRERRVDELLPQVGLPAEVKDRYPHEFSGGQRQRICIARALAVDPRLIVCDEPTSALDVSVQAQIINLLKDLQARLGLAYLFITHNLAVVEYLAHRVAVMYLGRIVEEGTVDEVLQSPKHPYTQALLSAIPEIEEARKREVIRLPGTLPSPADPPSGCHFHPRCPKALARCREAYPEASAFSDTHRARCFLYG